MPARMPDFNATSPGSPDSSSDPSPSKPATVARQPLAPRRKSSALHGVVLHGDDEMKPVPALYSIALQELGGSASTEAARGHQSVLPRLKKTEALRRTSSTFSATSTGSSEESGGGTPTKPNRESLIPLW